MKKYIGTKQVMAAPMTYGQAYKEGLIRENAYVEEYDERPGYLVEYADGYKSWSPADVFEAAYKVAETPLDRVNIEIADVMSRANKLGDTIAMKARTFRLCLSALAHSSWHSIRRWAHI